MEFDTELVAEGDQRLFPERVVAAGVAQTERTVVASCKDGFAKVDNVRWKRLLLSGRSVPLGKDRFKQVEKAAPVLRDFLSPLTGVVAFRQPFGQVFTEDVDRGVRPGRGVPDCDLGNVAGHEERQATADGLAVGVQLQGLSIDGQHFGAFEFG